eukprot:scaffold14_cov279-Pinguiococcus_pyrenoidosus.AAC.6
MDRQVSPESVNVAPAEARTWNSSKRDAWGIDTRRVSPTTTDALDCKSSPLLRETCTGLLPAIGVRYMILGPPTSMARLQARSSGCAAASAAAATRHAACLSMARFAER